MKVGRQQGVGPGFDVLVAPCDQLGADRGRRPAASEIPGAFRVYQPWNVRVGRPYDGRLGRVDDGRRPRPRYRRGNGRSAAARGKKQQAKRHRAAFCKVHGILWLAGQGSDHVPDVAHVGGDLKRIGRVHGAKALLQRARQHALRSRVDADNVPAPPVPADFYRDEIILPGHVFLPRRPDDDA